MPKNRAYCTGIFLMFTDDKNSNFVNIYGEIDFQKLGTLFGQLLESNSEEAISKAVRKWTNASVPQQWVARINSGKLDRGSETRNHNNRPLKARRGRVSPPVIKRSKTHETAKAPYTTVHTAVSDLITDTDAFSSRATEKNRTKPIKKDLSSSISRSRLRQKSRLT